MSAPRWVRVLITVPAALRDVANDVAQNLDFDSGGLATFDVPLGPGGAAEPTAYGCSTLMRPWTADQVESEMLPAFPGARFYSEAGWTIAEALADSGLVVLTSD